MLAAIGIILIATSFVGVETTDSEDIGLMSEVVVTGLRYEGEDIAYSGMMSEIVVTEPRYTLEEEMGMMPEIVVIAVRYDQPKSDLAFIHVLRRELSLRSFSRVYIGRVESRSSGLFN